MMRTLAAILALLCIGVGLWQLSRTESALTIAHTYAGQTPVTVFRKAGDQPAPVVVIAHGFAGSQELMLPFAVTLARAGYIAIAFDCLGHGRNPQPLRGSITETQGATNALLEELEQVVAFARTLPGTDGRLALLGHSMSSDIVIRYAEAHPEVAATVAVSMFSPVVTPTSPRNLDVIAGGLEFGPILDEARRVVRMVSGTPPEPRVTYGSFADGTARRFSLSGGVEHIGVLFSVQSMAEALNWLNAVFGRSEGSYLDERGPAIGVLFFGLVLLGWPLSKLLPIVSALPLGAALPWRKLLPIAIAPAILTPPILWKAPTAFLPILLGDYITLHFAVYGLLTAAALWIASRGDKLTASPVDHKKLAVAAALVAAYSVFAFGLPLDRFVISFWPIPQRLPFIAAVFAGALPFFLADEWLTRGEKAPRGSSILTKFCFLLSLAIAIALNFQKLFFLILIIPIILIFFIAYGLLGKWAASQTRHPLVGGISNAAAFAWAIAVTFPMVVR